MSGVPRILVVNPNSTQAVTDGIRNALTLVPGIERVDVDCVTLNEGPAGIETDEHISEVTPLLEELIGDKEFSVDAFAVACFSDPGVERLRSSTTKQVLGIGEAAYRSAAVGGRRFGVISILPVSVQRHRKHVQRLGLAECLAGDRPLGMGVTELLDRERTHARLLEVARQLRDEDDAEALVLGCAGMALYREGLERVIGIPVIDPCQAALNQLLSEWGCDE